MAHPSQESSFGDVPLHKYERLKQENIDLGCKLMEAEAENARLKAEVEATNAELQRLRDGLDGLANNIWG